MSAQNELSPYFTEIDLRTERALKGVREVRRSAKLSALPAEPRSFVVHSGFVMAACFVVALFLT